MVQPAGKGLGGLTEDLLGKALDKRLQCSPWEERPLTKEQVCCCTLPDSAATHDHLPKHLRALKRSVHAAKEKEVVRKVYCKYCHGVEV